jgi:hypothetical protein
VFDPKLLPDHTSTSVGGLPVVSERPAAQGRETLNVEDVFVLVSIVRDAESLGRKPLGDEACTPACSGAAPMRRTLPASWRVGAARTSPRKSTASEHRSKLSQAFMAGFTRRPE